MYADRAEEFSRKVTLAMNRAAYDDLLMGNRRRTSQTRTSVVTTGNIDSVKLDMIDTISVKSLGAAGKVLSIRSKVDTLRTNIALRRGDKTRYIYQEVRMPSFTALQFNLSRYDSLLTRYLADSGIGLPHSVDVIRGGDDGDVTEIRLDSLAARPAGAAREEAVIASQKDAPQIRNPKVFTSRVTTDDKLLFRVKIETPTGNCCASCSASSSPRCSCCSSSRSWSSTCCGRCSGRRRSRRCGWISRTTLPMS